MSVNAGEMTLKRTRFGFQFSYRNYRTNAAVSFKYRQSLPADLTEPIPIAESSYIFIPKIQLFVGLLLIDVIDSRVATAVYRQFLEPFRVAPASGGTAHWPPTCGKSTCCALPGHPFLGEVGSGDMNKLKKSVGAIAALLLWPYPEFAGLLVFLWVFWENLGDCTLRAYEDYQLTKTEKALNRSLDADVDGFYVHMLTTRSLAERERRNREQMARRRRIKAVSRAIAPAASWLRHLFDRGEPISMRPATGEE